MNTTTLHTEIAKTNQAALYREHLKIGHSSTICRIEIKADDHKPQGHARIDLHRGGEWLPLAGIFPHNMKTDTKLAYKQAEPTAADFSADRNELIALARLIGI